MGGINDGGATRCATLHQSAGSTDELPGERVVVGSLKAIHALPVGGQDDDFLLLALSTGRRNADHIAVSKGGVKTDKVFDLVRELRTDVTVPMVFMTYANVVFSYGAEKFIST